MSIDNDGEGGILALMSLLGVKRHRRPAIVLAGLLGAALIYGDGAITPAISVLSALEGFEIAAPGLTLCGAGGGRHSARFVRGAAVRNIAHRGGLRADHGGLVYFARRARRRGIARDPAVLAALNPYYGFRLLADNGFAGFLVLGGVFLCVTGAEALYADMGHFGKGPIRLAWSWIVFPSLVLNYAGQCRNRASRRADRQ